MFNTEIMEAIETLTCTRAYNYAKYLFYRSHDFVVFGGEHVKVSDLLSRFPDCPISVFLIGVWIGPPGRTKYREVTFDVLVKDWYYVEISKRNMRRVRNFQDALLEGAAA